MPERWTTETIPPELAAIHDAPGGTSLRGLAEILNRYDELRDAWACALADEALAAEEWLRATVDLAYLRGAVAIGGLADWPPPDEGRLFDAMNQGALAINDVRWIQFASEAIRALTAAMKVVENA